MDIDKALISKIEKNYLPILATVKSHAATSLLDEQNPYELFEQAVINDPGLCANLYRSIGERRPDKTTDHITLSSLANIYGITALRNKLNGFRDEAKLSFDDNTRTNYYQLLMKSTHMAKQVYVWALKMGDESPKQLSILAALLSYGELLCTTSRVDMGVEKFSLKEKLEINHQFIKLHNLPDLAKQATSTSFSGSYRAELLHWAYYFVNTFDKNHDSLLKVMENIGKTLKRDPEIILKEAKQVVVEVARNNCQPSIRPTAYYMLLNQYEPIYIEEETHSTEEIKLVEDNAEQYKKWISLSIKEENFDFKSYIEMICKGVDELKIFERAAIIRFSTNNRTSQIIWFSKSGQMDLTKHLPNFSGRDYLVEASVKIDKSLLFTPEGVATEKRKKLYDTGFLKKLSPKQLLLCPLSTNTHQSSNNIHDYIYLLYIDSTHNHLSPKQIELARITRSYSKHLSGDTNTMHHINTISPTSEARVI